MLTAFHCLWDGYGNWVNPQFRVGQDGTTQPYAAVNHTWKYWDQGFVDNSMWGQSFNIAESCTGSACSGTTPNIAFRIDKWLADQMMYWRSIY